MKKMSLLLATLLVCAMTAAAAVPADYTIQVPAGWVKNAGSSAREQYMKSGVSFILTVDTAPATVKTPDQYVEFVKKQLAGVFKNTKFEPVKKITVSGRDARELMYTGEMSGIKMQYDVVYVQKGNQYYTLTFGGMQETFDTVRSDVRAIVNSFKLK
jgi:hypothetical protein